MLQAPLKILLCGDGLNASVDLTNRDHEDGISKDINVRDNAIVAVSRKHPLKDSLTTSCGCAMVRFIAGMLKRSEPKMGRPGLSETP